MSDLGWKVKGRPWPWNLFIAIVSLGFTYQMRIYNDFGLTVLKKSTFPPKKSHLNALVGKFDIDVN